MASLYVKDAETNEMAQLLAEQRGISKAAAVKIALRHELDRDVRPTPTSTPSPALRPLGEALAAFRRAHPLGKPTGLLADKAFYDALWDED